MKLKDWKIIEMWVLERDRVTAPSKYNTKDIITNKLK